MKTRIREGREWEALPVWVREACGRTAFGEARVEVDAGGAAPVGLRR